MAGSQVLKFKAGDKVRINNTKSLWHSREVVVLVADASRTFPKAHPYQIAIDGHHYWFPEHELREAG